VESRLRVFAFLLGFGLILQATDNSAPSPSQLRAVRESIATAINTQYYDPKVAASRLQDQKLYESRILGAKTKQEAVNQIGAALADLHNSHLFF
jgi:hypothetical protein